MPQTVAAVGSAPERNNKKRKLEEVSNSKGAGVHASSKLNITMDKAVNKQRERSQPKAAVNQIKKKNKRAADEMGQDEEEVQMGQQDHSHITAGNSDGLFSLFSLAEQAPQQLKSAMDSLIQGEASTPEFVVKTMFLYFLELMGLGDSGDLAWYCQVIAKSSADDKKLKALFTEELAVSFDKLVFFSQDKKAIAQKKLLKKVCKLFVADVVDVLPDKAKYLSDVVERVVILSGSTQRLVRYAFTFVGLYIYKCLLTQAKDLSSLRYQLDTKRKNELRLKQDDSATSDQLKAISQALEIVKTSYQVLQLRVLMKRSLDVQEIVRKSVFEFILQLDANEVVVAFSKDNVELLDLVFNSLRDEDQAITRIGLQIVHHLISKTIGDAETQSVIQKRIAKEKNQILKMAIPGGLNTDGQTIQKALQVIQKLVEVSPGIFARHQLQFLFNLVHYPSQVIKEEVARLLMQVSPDFDDQNQLLELQKINPQKSNVDEFSVNFMEEPNKSQKQILKLIKLVESDVQTRTQYLKQVNNIGEKEEVPEDLVVPHMEKEEVSKIFRQDCEERAVLLFNTFQRLTSVVYDVQSMVALLKLEDIDSCLQETVAHLMFIALVNINQMKNQANAAGTKDLNNTTASNAAGSAGNMIFSKFWDLSTSYLQLSVINELVQMYRTNSQMLDPILKTMYIMRSRNTTVAAGEQGDKESAEDDIGRDLTCTLLKIVDKTDIVLGDSNGSESIVKSAVLNLVKLSGIYPSVVKELRNLVLDFNERLKLEAIPQLFVEDKATQRLIVNESSLGFILKYNILMSHSSLKDASDSEFVKGMASLCVVNFTQQLLKVQQEDHILEVLSRPQLNALFQVPFTLLEQLLQDSHVDDDTCHENMAFQSKLINQLVDFYLNIHAQFKSKHEEHQLSALNFLIETLILASGTENSNRLVIVGLSELPQAKDFIMDLIQSVHARIKGQDSVVQEQFQCLLTLFTRDFNSMVSEVGLEFLITFGCSRGTSDTVNKEMRKLYVSYKQRDSLMLESRKSILYSLILKAVMKMFTQVPDNKIMRIADASIVELQKEMLQYEEGGLEKFKTTTFQRVETFARVRNVQQFLKNFLNSIMLQVLHTKVPQGATGISKQQDEVAYLKFVEDLCRFSFTSPATYPLILSIKTCLHKSFLTHPKQIEAVILGVKNCVDRLKENSILSVQQSLDQSNTSSLPPSPETQANLEFLLFAVDRITLKGAGALDASNVSNQQVGKDKKGRQAKSDPLSKDQPANKENVLQQAPQPMEDNEEEEEEEEQKGKGKSGVVKGKPSKHVEGLQASMIGKKRVSAAKNNEVSKQQEQKRSQSSSNGGKKGEEISAAAGKKKKVK